MKNVWGGLRLLYAALLTELSATMRLEGDFRYMQSKLIAPGEPFNPAYGVENDPAPAVEAYLVGQLLLVDGSKTKQVPRL